MQKYAANRFFSVFLDRSKGSTDLLDTAFISPNLTKHDIQFQKGDDLGSDHLLIKVSIDAPLHRNSSVTTLTEKYSNQYSKKR